MARPEGLEPSTYRLTAGRSTIELRANKFLLPNYYSKSRFVCKLIFKDARHISLTNRLLVDYPLFVRNTEEYDDIYLPRWHLPHV